MNTNQSKQSLSSSFGQSTSKGNHFILNHIIQQLESKTNLSFAELKKLYCEEHLFQIGTYHVTTTKKALCTALKIPIEAGCRYKRTLEKNGNLVQSIDKVICPYTKHPAHLISSNKNEFNKLLKSITNQITLF